MTNREKINNMSNEELGLFLSKMIETAFCNECVAYNYCFDMQHKQYIACKKSLEKWLESEVEE